MKRYFAAFLLLLFSYVSFANYFADVPLSLSAKDKKSGFQLSPKYTVTSPTGTNIPVKTLNGENTALVGAGIYKVKAELEGYFTKEETVEIKQSDFPDGRGKIIEMDPQPSSIIAFVVTDAETNDAIEATIKLTSKSKTYSGKTLKENPTYKFIITQADSYQVEISAAGYSTQKLNQTIEVGDPPRQTTKPIAMQKIGNGIKVLIVGEDTNKPLRGVKLTVINTTDKITLIDNILPEAEAMVEVNSNKKYTANIEYEGYVSRKIDLNTNGNQTIKLQAVSYFAISAYDNLLNKRVPATVKVIFKGNVVADLKADASGDIRFNPTEKGKYEFEASFSNFKNGGYETDLQNLNSGKIPVRINLESSIDTYVIIIQDFEDKQMIQAAKAVFISADGVIIPSKYNSKTGEWKFELEKEKEYKLKIDAPNYIPIDETFIRPPSKLISKNLKKLTQAITFKTVDFYSKKLINATYKVLRPEQTPLTGVSDATKTFSVEMSPQKSYIIEVSADGYKSYSENLVYTTDNKGEKTIELSKDNYQLSLKAIDSQTKKVISNAKIAVLNQSNNQPLTSRSNEKGNFVADFNPTANFNAEFEADGYLKNTFKINVTELLQANKTEVELVLSKSPVTQYKIIAVNEVDDKKVLQADLRIFNIQNQPVPVSLNPTEMEWTVELKNDEAYSVEVKANGFLAYKNILQIEKIIKVKLKPIPKQEVTISVIDVFTQKPLSANYKFINDSETIPGTIATSSAKVNMTVLQDKNFDLEVTAAGYKSFKEPIKISRDGRNDFNVTLKKEFYGFTFKVLDSKTKKPIVKVNAKIVNSKDNQTVSNKLDPVSNEFSANLATDNNFTAQFESNGYVAGNIKIDVNSNAKSGDFKKEILLDAKEPEKKEEPKQEAKSVEVKITPPKEEPKPKIEEPKPEIKKEEPKKELPKPTPPVAKKEEKRVVDDAIVIEETELSVKVEVYENLVIGKRYRLGSVNFDQSTPNLKPKSNVQLEKLIRTLKLNPKLKIEITGHTDNVGDARANQYLSEQRATKIGNFIFNGGIIENRIFTFGKGQEEPIAPNDSELNRAKNRRVEFVLRDK